MVAAPARYAAVDQTASTTPRHGSTARSTTWSPTRSSSAGGATRRRSGTSSASSGKRPDITIIDDRTRLDENLGGLTDAIDANLGTRPVYVLRLDPREVKLLAERYDLEYIDGTDATSLTKVIAKKGS